MLAHLHFARDAANAPPGRIGRSQRESSGSYANGRLDGRLFAIQVTETGQDRNLRNPVSALKDSRRRRILHSLVRRYIKTAIIYLAVGLALGGWMMTGRELSGRFAEPYLRTAHTHAILVGFVMMMILGVALWLFPRPDKTDTRYRPVLAEVAYWMLAIGTGCRIAGEIARGSSNAVWLRAAVLCAGWAA